MSSPQKHFWRLDRTFISDFDSAVRVGTISYGFQYTTNALSSKQGVISLVQVCINIFRCPLRVSLSVRQCTTVATHVFKQAIHSTERSTAHPACLLPPVRSIPKTWCNTCRLKSIQNNYCNFSASALSSKLRAFCSFRCWDRRDSTTILATYPFFFFCRHLVSLHVLQHDRSSSSLYLFFTTVAVAQLHIPLLSSRLLLHNCHELSSKTFCS